MLLWYPSDVLNIPKCNQDIPGTKKSIFMLKNQFGIKNLDAKFILKVSSNLDLGLTESGYAFDALNIS